ncbi:MAG TPA: hypothetical protein VIN03_22635 [Roseateles sp.]
MQAAYSPGVDELEETPTPRPYRLNRRENLLALIRRAGGPTELSVALGTPKTHISAMTREGPKARSVGDELATRAEQVYGMPPGWMDEAHGGAPAAPAEPPTVGAVVLSLAEAFQQLDERRRETAASGVARLLVKGPDAMEAKMLDLLTSDLRLNQALRLDLDQVMSHPGGEDRAASQTLGGDQSSGATKWQKKMFPAEPGSAKPRASQQQPKKGKL